MLKVLEIYVFKDYSGSQINYTTALRKCIEVAKC